jgi:hypothetical protein
MPGFKIIQTIYMQLTSGGKYILKIQEVRNGKSISNTLGEPEHS